MTMKVDQANAMALDFLDTHCRLVESGKFGDPDPSDLYVLGLFKKTLTEASK